MPDPASDSPPDLTGQTLGDFRVERKLGQGGMGQVYLARQLSLKREVALKLLNTHLAQNDTALKRFQAEAEAVAQISHPNIVQVFAIGEHAGLRYMALEYVRGTNLRDFLERKGPPDLPVALSIIRQVAAALQRASELGIVHRDIKPENILLTKKVEVKVADFGLSRLTQGEQLSPSLTQSGVTVGTPLYMSPEQVRGQATDHRSDLYSLGVTAYHLLAGEPPFTGTNAIDVAMKHVNEEPPPLTAVRPDLPPEVCGVVHKMMAKKPADRYQTAKDILRDVAKLREGHTLGLTQTLGTSLVLSSASTAQLPLAASPSRWPLRILAGLAVAAVFAGGWFLFGRLHPPAATLTAPAQPGLPDARLPDAVKLVSARERELVAKLDKRGATPADVIDASIDLGLLYVKERRYPEAEKVFIQLEHEKPDRPRPVNAGFPVHATVSRLGLGIVQAHQDKTKDSLASFRAAVEPLRKPGHVLQLQQFFMERRDLVLAVAEAVQRDAENLPKGEKLPPLVDRLRSPATMLKD